MSARGRLTCRDAMLCLRRSHWVFCLALYISSLAPAPGEALAHPGLAYVVSPPPATRQMMPNYLPKLPPESTAGVPRVSAHSAPRLRAGCRSCRLRPRHIRRCAHCRHGVENPSASRRHHRAGHRAHHRHGHFGQHQRHVPRHWRHATTPWTRFDVVFAPRSLLMRGTGEAHREPRAASGTTLEKFGWLVATHVSHYGWYLHASLREAGCSFRDRNPAAMNQQVAIIDLRKSQLSPTSAAVLCHFISASNRTRGDADWRLGGT
jgi:hypothetical protein